MNLDKIKELDKIIPPRNKKQLRSFIGCVNYYSRFIYNYAMFITPFLPLLKKNSKWNWTDLHDKAFYKLLAEFHQSCMLTFPDFQKKFILQTDCSDSGMGAILYQGRPGEENVVALISRVLKDPEKKFSVTEKEACVIVWALHRLREYLVGRHFLIVTDHKALTFLQRCHPNNDRLYRWILWLQQFSFAIEHCPGIKNFLPDLLSRNQVLTSTIQTKNTFFATPIELGIMHMPGLSWSNVAKFQDEDEQMKPIRRFLKGELEENEPTAIQYSLDRARWKLIDDVLLTRVSRDPDVYRIWIPPVLTTGIIWLTHTTLAHFGPDKIDKTIREVCFWKGRRKQIITELRKCVACQKTKYPNRHFAGAPQPIIPSKPQELAAIDIYGPLPKTKYGYRYIFVCVDVFTKFVQVYPLNRANTRNCLHKLNKFFSLAGNYERILSDHGPQFTSEQWMEAMNQLEIVHVLTSIRHPQSNPSERLMKELSRIIRLYAHQQHQDWYLILPIINRVLNQIYHDSSGLSPHEAHFNEKPPHPLQILIREDISQNRRTQEEILSQLQEAAERRRRKWKGKPYTFRTGDKVLLRVPKPSDLEHKQYTKFFQLFQGPYNINRIIEPNVAELTNNEQIIGKFNFYSLKPFHE